MLAENRRITVHSGGCVPLAVAGTFVHYERHNYTAEDQSYGAVGKRVYVSYDSENGELLAIIAGCPPFYRRHTAEDEFATETAITSAVGTRRMAREDARVMGLYGTGRQARRHLEAMCAIRPIAEVKVYSRGAGNRRAFCETMQPYVDAELVPGGAARGRGPERGPHRLRHRQQLPRGFRPVAGGRGARDLHRGAATRSC